MPGLLRGVARTAVVAGTATTVSNRVSRRQAQKWGSQDAEYVPARVAPEPAPAAPAAPDRYEELERLASLHTQGVLTDDEFAKEKARLLAT
jgi:hypothetical protein